MLKWKKGAGISVYHEKKNITVNSGEGVPVLELTNVYGNTLRYEIADSHSFDSLLANLWQFVKDSQH